MSEEPTTLDLVELVRWSIEEIDRSWDFDAVAGYFAPDAVWDLAEVGLGTYKGVRAIREFNESYWATWEDHHHKIEEIVDLGHGVLLVVLREDGRPVGSNASVQQRNVLVYEWVQGKIVRVTTHYSLKKARAAAGRLAEERG